MPWTEALSFADQIQKPGATKQNLHLFRDALLAVEFIHSHGYLHRDIKPANIGIQENTKPRAVLLDLGGAVCPPTGLINPEAGRSMQTTTRALGSPSKKPFFMTVGNP
ncbi:hypothetical protein K469DRAFT_692081 [Zopfia rhizophila CBS 207.26]|uniref:Protein kinase domain-containing protein n=1 Tax=Zopfia rhizophila CBS 207.26 TaxID=1314779 RepID=A0A6A6DNR6_9PEZI|nr:hypothetical protein K469DRAFT_692081 [Zopfia rhizophila CBS 207.26]